MTATPTGAPTPACRLARHRQPEGSGAMNHLHRELAPISDAGWDLIDDEAKSRLPTYLAARKLVDFVGPHGWTHSSTNLGRIEEIAGPSEGVAAAAAQGPPPRRAADRVQGLADRARRRRPGHEQPRSGRAGRGPAPDRPGRERHRLPRLRGRRDRGHHREHLARAHRHRRHRPRSRRRGPRRRGAAPGRDRRSLRAGHLPRHVHQDRRDHRDTAASC